MLLPLEKARLHYPEYISIRRFYMKNNQNVLFSQEKKGKEEKNHHLKV